MKKLMLIAVFALFSAANTISAVTPDEIEKLSNDFNDLSEKYVRSLRELPFYEYEKSLPGELKAKWTKTMGKVAELMVSIKQQTITIDLDIAGVGADLARSNK